MSTVSLGPLKEYNDVIELRLERNTVLEKRSLELHGFSYTRADRRGAVYVDVDFEVNSGITVSKVNQLDFDLMRSRTRNHMVTERKDGEKIILKLNSDKGDFESDRLYLCYVGNDRFILFAEACFEVVNKVYSPSSYDPSAIDLSDKFLSKVNMLRKNVKEQGYDPVYANTYRGLIYSLDEIITGKATNALRKAAENKKRILKSELRKLRELSSISHQSKTFQDRLHELEVKHLKEFIALNQGEKILSSILENAMAQATREFKDNGFAFEDTQTLIGERQSELERIEKQLNALSYKDELLAFSKKVNPPTLSIGRCCENKCKASLTRLPDERGGRDSFCVLCTCGKQGGKYKKDHDAIIDWNVNNIRLRDIPTIDGLRYDGLNNDALKLYIGEVDKFTSLMLRKFNLLVKLEGGRYSKRHNKHKGMVNILLSLNNYVKKTLNH
jgi:hypothetical protein